MVVCTPCLLPVVKAGAAGLTGVFAYSKVGDRKYLKERKRKILEERKKRLGERRRLRRHGRKVVVRV